MTPTVIEEYIFPVLTRYIDRYHWGWNVSKRLINNYYGTEYTEKQLKKLYRQKKIKIPAPVPAAPGRIHKEVRRELPEMPC